MINFDQVGLKNNTDKILASAASAETDNIANMGEMLSAKLSYIMNEDLGISKFLSQTAGRREQFQKLYDVTGDEKWKTSILSELSNNLTYDNELDLSPTITKRNQDLYEASVDEIKALQKEYPSFNILTPDELTASIAERARLNREEVSRLVARSSSNVDLVSNIVSMGAYFLDPVVLATLPITGGASVGRGVVGNAWRSFKIEAAVAGGAEVAITPQVAEYKKEINSPFTLQDAAFRIIGASAGAGVIRGTGSVVLDSAQLFKASRLLKKQGNNADAAIVENYAKVVEGVQPEAHNAHVQAFQASRQAFEEGRFIEPPEIERIYKAHNVDLNKAIGRGEFEDILQNRDFNYLKADGTVDALLYAKTVLARNPIEKQLSLYMDNPKLFKKAIDEVGLVFSSEKSAMVKPPKNLKKYFDGKEKLKVATKKDLEKLRLEMSGSQALKKTTLAELTKQNKSTAPKIPVKKVFLNDRAAIPKDKRVDINDSEITGLPLLEIDVAKIIPTQKTISIPNLKAVAKAKKIPESDEVLLVEDNGLFYVMDGHHRVANKILNADNLVSARVLTDSSSDILKQTQPRNVELRLDKAEQDDLAKSQIQDVQEMIDADDGLFMEVPTFKTDEATGELEVSTRPAKEVFEEIDNQDKAMDDIFSCVMGASA